MSDIYIPGVRSRFNSERIVEDLMKIERLPRDRIENSIDDLGTRRAWWQDLGRRVTSLRDSARMLYSFQNPFNERTAISSNDYIITATATREAEERDYQFAVKQLAQADRFLSNPLDEKTTVDAGRFAFTVGNEEISFNFRGGSLREFADAVNRQGRGKIGASLIAVQQGNRSLLLESKVTGAENSLGFSGDALNLAVRLGIVETEGSGGAAVLSDAGDGEEAAAGASPASINLKPLRAVSTAQDAVITMEGIEITRPTNSFDDLIPGVTITARNVSDRAERIEIQADREGVKDAIISLVGNYNRLMAELNILTRADERLIDELAYLDSNEVDEMRRRLGAFSGDTTLNQFRANLLRAVSSPYPTDEDQFLSMLSHIGISTNTRVSGGTGYNPSRLRGYLEIDEKALDTAIEQNLLAIKQLFASSSTGDVLADTGVAVNVDALARPFVETGGIIALKTGTIDSRIAQDQRRVDSMERRLAAREADLRMQYSRMENAYARMEQMSNSLDNFSRQNSNNNSR